MAMMNRIEAGETQAAIAAENGVTRSYINQLWLQFRAGGEEGLKPKPQGRKCIRRITESEQEQIHQIIKAHQHPSEAGLPRRGKENVWNLESASELVRRELKFKPGKTQLSQILRRWNILPSGQSVREETKFGADYYSYVNSEVGKEVARREAAWIEKEEREGGPRARRRGRPPKKEADPKPEPSAAARHAFVGDDIDVEDIDYGNLDSNRLDSPPAWKAGPLRSAPAANQRVGKHRKGKGQKPKRKKKGKGKGRK
jgi:hypothetical protein